MMLRNVCFVIVLLTGCNFKQAEPNKIEPAANITQISDYQAYKPASSNINKIIKQHNFAKYNLGYALYDTNNSKLVAKYNYRKNFIPASSIKILTNIAALDRTTLYRLCR